MEKIILNVEGMMCSHCENAVKKSVGELLGVKSVEVNLEAKTVTVEFISSETNQSKISETIEDIGFEVK